VSSSSGFPLRIQSKMSSTSSCLSSGVLLETGMEPAFLNAGTEPSSTGFTPTLRHQSRAPSISLALSSGVWPFFLGNIWSILANSSPGVSKLLGLPCLIQDRMLSTSFCLSSGLRFETGMEGTFSNLSTGTSSGSTPTSLHQSITASISRALSSGVWPFFGGSR